VESEIKKTQEPKTKNQAILFLDGRKRFGSWDLDLGYSIISP
jgi:hypothetical protein